MILFIKHHFRHFSGINVDLIDDEEGLFIQNHKDPHRAEEIEKATDELTKDSAHIRALMNNPFEEVDLDIFDNCTSE